MIFDFWVFMPFWFTIIPNIFGFNVIFLKIDFQFGIILELISLLFKRIFGYVFISFSSCSEQGCSLVMVHGLFFAVASLVEEHRPQDEGFQKLQHVGSVIAAPRLESTRLSNCCTWVYFLCRMWGLPRPGIKTTSPTLATVFFTTEPPGKPQNNFRFTKHLYR